PPEPAPPPGPELLALAPPPGPELLPLGAPPVPPGPTLLDEVVLAEPLLEDIVLAEVLVTPPDPVEPPEPLPLDASAQLIASSTTRLAHVALWTIDNGSIVRPTKYASMAASILAHASSCLCMRTRSSVVTLLGLGAPALG